MGFWIFMLIANLLIPLSMIGLGNYFAKRAPKEINMVFGYRTAMSTKNKETWEFAHHHCGKIWLSIGWILLPASFAAMMFVIGKDEGFLGIYGAVVCGVQLVALIGSIIPTEMALKRTFDKNGDRRQPIT